MEKKEFNLLKAVRNIANGNELSVEERAFVENGKIKLPTEKRSAIVAAANGANEEAVKLFLEGKIKFLQIADLVEAAISAQNNVKDFSADDIFEADSAARRLVRSSI